MGEVERLDVGALNALRREFVAGVGERAGDLLLSRSIVAFGPGDQDVHAGCRARVGTGVIPPGPAVPHPGLHGLVAGEGSEHVEQPLNTGESSAVGLQVVGPQHGDVGVLRLLALLADTLGVERLAPVAV